jgi:Flp pilus assembly protein TadG
MLGRRSDKASASVEFALVASLLLLPLLLGGADFLAILSAQAQLNTALQSLYYFAFTDPTSANNTTDVNQVVSLINSASVFKITLPATTSSGATNASLSYGCFTPPSTTITYQSTQCSATQTQQTLVTYQVSTSVVLPFPLLKLGNPLTLNATGTVQVE